MYEYKIIYQCSDGYKGEEIVMAVNRVMAFEVFADLGIENVVNADCFRVPDKEFENKVICNNCMKEFFENEIIYDGDEDMEFCPYCGEGGCITK